MRALHLLVLSSACASVLLMAKESAASEPNPDDASIGTRPAQATPNKPAAAPPRPSEPKGVAVDALDAPNGDSEQSYGAGAAEAPLATDPPRNWAVLHAGLRPHLGTFGGIATFALAHARTEQFYGAFSLSAIRNDAGTHVGAAQIAIGRNLADTFAGGLQLSLTENRARDFTGLGQTSLGYNRAGSITSVYQLAGYNRARKFHGVLQLGGYDRTDDEFVGLAQVGVVDIANKDFLGVAQVGAFEHTEHDFTGIVQVGVLSSVGKELFELDNDSKKSNRFGGVAQLGVVSTVDGNFYGLTQFGAGSLVSGDFNGIAQVGMFGAVATRFRGLAQTGVVAVAKESIGMQIGGGAIAFEKHEGIQIGALGTYAKSVDGAQIGIANIAEHVRGLQIGIFNQTKSLRGVQIGVANHAEDGVLPWTAILNMGFGDGDGGGVDDDQYRSNPKAARLD